MAHGNELGAKRYFWLKLMRGFFRDARIKKMRKLPGGDTLVIIYEELMLLSIEKNGMLVYEGIYDSFAEEIADKIDEEKNIDSVKLVLAYLEEQGLGEKVGDDWFLPQAAALIGSETYNNVYKRNKRQELESNTVGKIPTTFQPHSNQIPTEKDTESDIDNIYTTPRESILLVKGAREDDVTDTKRATWISKINEHLRKNCHLNFFLNRLNEDVKTNPKAQININAFNTVLEVLYSPSNESDVKAVLQLTENKFIKLIDKFISQFAGRTEIENARGYVWTSVYNAIKENDDNGN